jgi:hypothetical protein
MATSLSLTAYYHLHPGERYRDIVIIAIVGTGVIVSFIAGLESITLLLCILPWCGILATLSATYISATLQANPAEVNLVAELEL